MTTYTFRLEFDAEIEANNPEEAQNKLSHFIWEDRPQDITLLGAARGPIEKQEKK